MPFAIGAAALASAGAAWILGGLAAEHGGLGLHAFNPLLQAHGLLIGCLLALLLRRHQVTRHGTLVAAGLAILVAALAVGRIESHHPWALGWNVLSPEITAALLIAGLATTSPRGLGKLFALRPVVWIGTRSYAIYLWHLPLIVLAERYGLHGHRAPLVAVPLAFLAAEVSYRWVEAPFLRLKDRMHPAAPAAPYSNTNTGMARAVRS
jgi:peptidoglycan/LPS O-acetylase OafA/YrhL